MKLPIKTALFTKTGLGVLISLLETIELIPSGRDQDASYAARLEGFVWNDFFRDRGGGELLERTR